MYPLIDSLAAVPIAVLLIYVPHVLKIVAISNKTKKDNEKRPVYDLRNPRVSTELATDTSSEGLYIARCQGAHLNGFETFSIFAAAVALANIAGVDRGTIDLNATAFVLARVAYIYIYVNNTKFRIATLRSLMWLIQFGTSLYLMYRAATTRK